MLSTIIEEVLRLENLLKREIGPSLRLRLLFSVILMFEYEQKSYVYQSIGFYDEAINK